MLHWISHKSKSAELLDQTFLQRGNLILKDTAEFGLTEAPLRRNVGIRVYAGNKKNPPTRRKDKVKVRVAPAKPSLPHAEMAFVNNKRAFYRPFRHLE